MFINVTRLLELFRKTTRIVCRVKTVISYWVSRKETQCKCIERGECSKITVKNN